MPTRKGVPSGQCGICRHPERVRAELLVAGGASFNAVGRKFGMQPQALRRHWLKHVSEERRANLVLGPVQRQALAARVAEESESVIDHHKAVRAGLLQTYEAVLNAGDANGVGLIAGRLIEVNNALGRLTGELASSPLIQNNTVNVFTDSSFLRFQDDLIRALNRFPDAREAVLAEFAKLARTTAPRAPALLEHRDHDT